MYVISLVTEYDVVKGGEYRVSSTGDSGMIYVIDDIGDEYALFAEEWVKLEGEEEVDILRERIEALQEENAELKLRLDSLEK